MVYTAYFRCDISLCYENHGIEFRATKDRSNKLSQRESACKSIAMMSGSSWPRIHRVNQCTEYWFKCFFSFCFFFQKLIHWMVTYSSTGWLYFLAFEQPISKSYFYLRESQKKSECSELGFDPLTILIALSVDVLYRSI